MTVAGVEAPQLEAVVGSALAGCAHAVLAVSGGLDSMVLLMAASRLPPHARRNILVATFDRQSGRSRRPSGIPLGLPLRHGTSVDHRNEGRRVETRAVGVSAAGRGKARFVRRDRAQFG
jgi:hypothetical protein